MTDFGTAPIQLPADQRRLLRALEHAARLQPAGAWFEQGDDSARQLGVAEDVLIAADRETVRSLNHMGVLRFDRRKAPRWVFTLDPRAAEFTA